MNRSAQTTPILADDTSTGPAQFCEKLIVVFFFGFALWTVGCNVITFFHLPAYTLTIWLCASLLGALIFSGVASQANQGPESSQQYPREQAKRYEEQINWRQLLGLCGLTAGSIACATISYKSNSMWPLFIGFTLILTLSRSTSLFSANVAPDVIAAHRSASTQRTTHGQWYGLAAFTLTVIALYLFAHQADGDDANFINLGIGAFRSEAGVFALDTMLGDGPTPLHLPTYLLHSYELLFATLAQLLPGSTLLYAHIIVPLIFIVLFTATLYRLYWAWLGHYWLMAAMLHIGFLCLCLDGYPSLGAHGLFRFIQGKAAFINIVVPLIMYVGVRWMRHGDWKDWALLTTLQIGSVGLTANAVYAAPLALGLALFPFIALQPQRLSTYWRVTQGLASCAYPLAMGLVIVLSGKAYPSEELSQLLQAPTLFGYFGWNVIGLLCVASLPLLHLLNSISEHHRQYVWAYTLGYTLFIVNPLLWPLYSFVTGNLGGRIYWSTPFAIGFAYAGTVLILSSFHACRINTTTLFRGSHALALVLAAIAIASTWRTSNSNTVRIRWSTPTLKVHQESYRTALEAIAATKPGCQILAPSHIALNIPMVDNHPYPVAVSELYQTHYRHTMEETERSLRSTLLNSVSSSAQRVDERIIRLGVTQFNIGTVVVNNNSVNATVFSKSLIGLGFTQFDIDSMEGLTGFHRASRCDAIIKNR